MRLPAVVLMVALAQVMLAAAPVVSHAQEEKVVAQKPAKSGGGLTPEDVAATFSDEELIDGFLRTVYGAEGSEPGLDTTRLNKFTGPVRVWIETDAVVDRRDRVERFIRILDRVINNLDIRMAKKREDANMEIFLVNRSQYTKVIRDNLKDEIDTRFLEENHCSAVTSGTPKGVLKRATVFIAASEMWPDFRHCMVEEITQTLGPVNDDPTLVYSIYNDSSTVPGFGIFDWYILNMLYDRRVKPGMTADEVTPVLPRAIADARKRLKRLVATGVIDTGGAAAK